MKFIFRLIYCIFIFLLIFISLPLQIIIFLLILFFSGRPIIYQQKRVGEKGKIFTLLKFRTMTVGAEKTQSKFKKLNEATGPVFKIHHDPRFTGIGKFLSHTGLDELPQLFNVLKGDMELIGPRPLPVSETKKLKTWQQKRHQIKPGIISPWIVNGYHKQSFAAWMKSDIDYIKKKSLKYDLYLFFKTLGFVLKMFIGEFKNP